jgi:hypothetical protein
MKRAAFRGAPQQAWGSNAAPQRKAQPKPAQKMQRVHQREPQKKVAPADCNAPNDDVIDDLSKGFTASVQFMQSTVATQEDDRFPLACNKSRRPTPSQSQHPHQRQYQRQQQRVFGAMPTHPAYQQPSVQPSAQQPQQPQQAQAPPLPGGQHEYPNPSAQGQPNRDNRGDSPCSHVSHLHTANRTLSDCYHLGDELMPSVQGNYATIRVGWARVDDLRAGGASGLKKFDKVCIKTYDKKRVCSADAAATGVCRAARPSNPPPRKCRMAYTRFCCRS